MLQRNQRLLKRLFDLSISSVLCFFLSVPLLVLILIATFDSKRNGLFVQQRIGYNGKPFSFFKIRSLKGEDNCDIKAIRDSETKLGSWLRRTKIDELPQLFNVLGGDMSLVGPRPDVQGYADCLTGDDRIILSVKPGITGPATIKYKNEEDLLLKQENPKHFNDTVIWPDKVLINKEYVKSWSLQKDIGYLFASIVK